MDSLTNDDYSCFGMSHQVNHTSQDALQAQGTLGGLLATYWTHVLTPNTSLGFLLSSRPYFSSSLLPLFLFACLPLSFLTMFSSSIPKRKTRDCANFSVMNLILMLLLTFKRSY